MDLCESQIISIIDFASKSKKFIFAACFKNGPVAQLNTCLPAGREQLTVQ
jgi:hypothetical protein